MYVHLAFKSTPSLYLYFRKSYHLQENCQSIIAAKAA